MNPVLMKAIVDLAVFCGVSGDDIVHPDAAVAQLEQLAFTLKQLTSAQILTITHISGKTALAGTCDNNAAYDYHARATV
jgi:hypothetical protein